jgi:hypothetical protein
MDDDTTTATTDVQTGAEEAQPVTDAGTTAADVTTTTEPSEESQDASTEVETPAEDSAPEADDKLQKYAKSQGLELDSPSAIKAAQIAMKAQSEATRNYHKTTELEKTLSTTSDEVAEVVAEQTGQDPELLKRLQRVEVKEAVRDFWNQDNIDRSYEPKMIELLQTKPHLAGDLESLYATAVMQSGKLDSVKSQGGREALERLAHNQTAAVPRGNATNPGTTPKEKPFRDLSISEMEAKLGSVQR